MGITATQLRANIFNLLDQVIQTGIPLEIERKGAVLKIVPVQETSRLARLIVRPDVIKGDPDDLIHMDWSGEWQP